MVIALPLICTLTTLQTTSVGLQPQLYILLLSAMLKEKQANDLYVSFNDSKKSSKLGSKPKIIYVV